MSPKHLLPTLHDIFVALVSSSRLRAVVVVSAAEKLRALDAAVPHQGRLQHPMGMEPGGSWHLSISEETALWELRGALPEIMAVVVLAEGIAETDAPVWGTRDGLGFKLQNALAALDEQLDLGSPPTSERSTAL